jgi:hypothetical protein
MQNVGEVEVQPVQILVGREAEALRRDGMHRVDTASNQDSYLPKQAWLQLGKNW